MDPHRYTFPPAPDQRPHQHPPPPPPPGQWYPPLSQFQYQTPPAPPPQQHWGPPPPPYPGHGQYLPAHPHLPPPYPPPPQDMGNTNWGHHQGWEYSALQNGEDWAAKARAWAASKSASENQQPQSQFTPVSRLEGQSPYHDPYPQPADVHYTDVQSYNPSPGYHQYPPPGAPPQRSSLTHPQEYTPNNSGPSSFVPDEHVAYGSKDGRFGGDSNAVYPHQGSSSASSMIHMQEVPSSYSSISGTVESGDGREKVYKSFPLPSGSSQVPLHDHLPPPPVIRSVLREESHYSLSNHAAGSPVDLSDQPLNFTRKFSFDQGPMMQPNYDNDRGGPVRGVDPVASTSSNHTWTSHLPGTAYPSFLPVLAFAQQHESSLSLTSSISGYPTPFERMSGPNFQTSTPSVGIGATSGIHPTTVFPGDVYGVHSGSDRPKKPPVPVWLTEELIKNKAIIGSSGPERPVAPLEDEAFDKTPGRDDQENSKSIGSPSSAVEDDEEENMEAAKTVEINQEIKRILTEVLLKVTDELFDEIATKVLEEDLTTQVSKDVAPVRKPSFAVPRVSIPKASAKVIVAAEAKEVETDDESGKSTSSAAGDLLGLASYASDDDGDDNSVQHRPVTEKTSKDDYAAENGSAQANERDSDGQEPGNNNNNKPASNGAIVHHDAIEENFEERKTMETHDTSKPDDNAGEKVIKTESTKDVKKKLSAADDSGGREARNKQHNKDSDTGEARKSYVERDNVKDGKVDESHKRHVRIETRNDKSNGSKEKIKDQGVKSTEKAKEYDSKKRLSDPDSKTYRKEKERDERAIDRDDSDRRKEHKKEKEERSRDKHRSESSRHRKQRSPSVGSRDRSSKGNSLASRVKNSSGESSDDSKRKLHTRKRNLSRSPSPSRTRKRQDSRSPPSKHSRRRHSPLSSLESTRGRRSRSRSQALRRR